MATILTDLLTRSRYSQAAGIQRILPTAVTRPADEGELAEVVEWARREGLGITARGAGSAMDGGCLGAGVIVDCSVLNSTLEIDVARHTCRVGCSVSLGAIERSASARGLRLGPDPSSASWATVGGVIGTNAAGSRTFRLGAMDAWVQGLRLMTVDGPLDLTRGVPPDPSHPVIRRWNEGARGALAERRASVLARWPDTRKNTAGYGLGRYWRSGELIDLVIGAEGTLGVVTEATLRLEEVPAHRVSLRLMLADRQDLLSVIEAMATADPTTIELLDRTFLRFVAPLLAEHGEEELGTADALLLVDVEDDDPERLHSRIEISRSALATLRVKVDVATAPAEIERLWSIRHRASPILAALADGRVSLQVIEDGCVPRNQLARYLVAVEQIAGRHGVEVVMFGHAGDGHVHVNLLPNLRHPHWETSVRAIYNEVFAELQDLGGTPSGEHGAGRLRSPLLGRLLGRDALECFQAIKDAFDPTGSFNPGVIVSDGADPFAQLKYGESALPFAPGVAEEFHEIEAHRRYAESRWPL